MARIIHRFRWRGSSRNEPPGFKEPGLVLVLDPAEVPEDPGLAGKSVRFVSPDGSKKAAQVTASSKQTDGVGLLFAWAEPGLVPPDVTVEWD